MTTTAAAHADMERRRIAFVESRDGPVGARAWAERTVRVYRSAVLDRARRFDIDPKNGNVIEINYKGHYASRMPWKLMFIVSYLELKRYLKNNE